MGLVSKFIIGIGGIAFSIILLAVLLPAQIQQEQATRNLIQQDTTQLNTVSENMLVDCGASISVSDLTDCKSEIETLKTACQTPPHSSMAVCSDPRIGQFLSTVDGKVVYAESVINNGESKVLNTCVDLIESGGNSQECALDMQNIQQACSLYNVGNHMSVCSDPRVSEILAGSIHSQLPSSTIPDLNQQGQNANSTIQSANQYTLSYIDSCMKATDPSVLQICSQTARTMLNYCNSVSSMGIGQICSDPRLQQLANMGQATAPTVPGQPQVNTTAFYDLNNQMQYILNLCDNSTISSSSTCINAVSTVKQACDSTLEKTYPSYFPACADSRLQ
ncbi:MAG: hypothetical protein KGI33_01195 [Thaumarchaeota archaeon]|nr:hypothetical protein [Nitrososphaerota archaeon]